MDNCFTRLRVTVNDPAFVKEQALKALPCSGVVQSGCDVQIVYGIRAPQVRQAVEQRLDRALSRQDGGESSTMACQYRESLQIAKGNFQCRKNRF